MSRFQASIDLVLASARRHGLRAALIGGFALPFHGVQRATGDVDFLIDGRGADALVGDLAAAGFSVLHRSDELANLQSPGPSLAPVDLLFANRAGTLAMLDRTVAAATVGGGVTPVVDAAGIIGLKLQAMANDPRRTRRDEDDVIELLAVCEDQIDTELLRSYFSLFGVADALPRYLAEARARRA